jgi:hypothetical protein
MENPKYRQFNIIGPPGCRNWWRVGHKPADSLPNEVSRLHAISKSDHEIMIEMECRALNDAYRMGFKAAKERLK